MGVVFRNTDSWALPRPCGVRICRDKAQLGGRCSPMGSCVVLMMGHSEEELPGRADCLGHWMPSLHAEAAREEGGINVISPVEYVSSWAMGLRVQEGTETLHSILQFEQTGNL